MKKVKNYKRSSKAREDAKQKNQQMRRRRKKRKYMLYYILILIIILTTTISLSLTVFFNIENIEVKNPYPYTADEIISASGLELGDNLIRTRLGEIEKKILKNCINLDEVHANRKFPNTLSITCVIATIKYCCQKPDGSYIYISNSGRVIDIDQAEAFDGVLIISYDQLGDYKKGDYLQFSKDEKQKIDSIISGIENAQLKDITKISITKDKIEITYQNRILIEINNMSKIEYILMASAKIIDEYIGVNESGKILFDEVNQSIHFLP